MEPKLVVVPEIDAVADEFFEKASLAPVERYVGNDYDAHDDRDDHEARHALRGTRRAMHATLAILAVTSTAVGAFLLYSKVLMPTPVALGQGGPIAPPSLSPLTATTATTTVLAAQLPPVSTAAALEPAATEPVPAQELGAPPAATLPQTSPKDRAARTSRPAAPVRDSLLREAFTHLDAGRLGAAVASARRALDTHPERADAWLVLGSAYDRLSDTHSAQLAYRACAARARGPFLRECQKLAR